MAVVELSQGIDRFVRAHVGSGYQAVARGSSGAAFRITGHDGRVVYLKAHRHSGKHHQELHAYQHWAPRLPVHTPPLLADQPDPPALLLGGLSGVPYDEAGLGPASQARLHEMAGAALAVLHGLPVAAVDPVPIARALAARAEALRARAARIAPRAADRVARELRAWAPVLQDVLRVPCHRDFEPRNWLVGPEGRAVLDFEHCRPDLWLADLTRLATFVWPEAPERKDAFFAGYGRTLDREEAGLLEALCGLEAVSTYTWGVSHRDAGFTARGRAAMNRLGRDPE